MILPIYISLLFAVSLFAFVMSGIVGGGASTLIIPFLALKLPVSQVPAALVTGTFSSALTRVVVMKRHIRWSVVRWFVPAAVPAVVLGSWLLAYVDPLIIIWLMGLSLLGNIVSVLAPKPTETRVPPVQAPSCMLIMSAAVIGGLISGLTGAIGLLLNRFYFNSGMSKEEIVATRAANEILLHLFKIAVYFQLALFSREALLTGAIVAAAAFLSTHAVRIVLPLLNENIFRRAGYASMVLSGALLMVQTTRQIAEERQPAVMKEAVHNGTESHLVWNGRRFTFELEQDGGFTFERQLDVRNLPPALRVFASQIGASDEQLMVEECFGLKGRFYELHVREGVTLRKYELSLDGSLLRDA